MLPSLLLGVGRVHDIWYILPLVLAVSVVYSATRFESGRHILWGSVRNAAWMSGVLLGVFAVLALLSAQL